MVVEGLMVERMMVECVGGGVRASDVVVASASDVVVVVVASASEVVVVSASDVVVVVVTSASDVVVVVVVSASDVVGLVVNVNYCWTVRASWIGFWTARVVWHL